VGATDLVTVKEAKDFLTLTGDEKDALVADLVARASSWIEALASRPLKERQYTDLRLPARNGFHLYPPAWPIATDKTVTVYLDSTLQTIWRTEADGDPATFDVVVAGSAPWDERLGRANTLYRALGWGLNAPRLWDPSPYPPDWSPLNWPNPYRIRLTYVGGYRAVPPDLQQACLYLVQKMFRDTDKQQTGMTTISLPTGGSITVPDPSVPKEVLSLVAPYRRFVLGAV